MIAARLSYSGCQYYFKAMPSILSHPAVAVALRPALQRFRVPGWMLWMGIICSIVPDFDVISIAFDVSYGDVLGHRGFTHSLLFAAILSVILVQVFLPRQEEASKPACLLFLFLCTASHGALDALTNGGLGVAFFAPFDDTRYFLPWRPIQVSPIGLGFFSARGLTVFLSEIAWVWLPALLVTAAATLINRFVRKR